MVEDVVKGLLPGQYQMIVAWALEKGADPPSGWPVAGLRSWEQRGEGLGDRLYESLGRACSEFSTVCVIGTDHPGLDKERVEEAFAALEEESEVVLGPAADGGYYLVGLRASALTEKLFAGIDWSTSRVFSQTEERCEEAGLSLHSLPIAHDVDTQQDVRDLEERLRRRELDSPRVQAVLAAWRHQKERAS